MGAFRDCKLGPQGLTPPFFATLSGTAEAVPYPRAVYETSNTHLGKPSFNVELIQLSPVMLTDKR